MYYKYWLGSVGNHSACKIEAIRFPETSAIQPIPNPVPHPERELIRKPTIFR
jgi:hypothetical protein